MEIIWHSLSGLLTVMIVIGTGFVLERGGWVKQETESFISKIVNNVCLPPYMITSILSRFTHDQLLGMANGLVVPFITMVTGYLVAKVLARIIGVSKSHRSIFTICVGFSNTIFIGLPLCVALFGDIAVPYIMLYYMVNTTLFWTIGVHDLAADNGEETPIFSRKTLKSIFTPPLMGFATGIIMVLMGWGLPKPLFDSFRLVGSMTTPLAMLFIGIAMSKADWNALRVDAEMVVAVAGRFIICPLIVLAILPFMHLNELEGRVFVIMAAMPSMTNISIISKQYGGDYKYAAVQTTVSTVVAVAAIPFYMWIIH